jgi:F-type H+-transporting ATPase subunit epsilon
MHLSILTPERPLVDTDVTEVYAPGFVGQLGVLPNHITFLATLGTGRLTYRGDAGAGLLVISGGVIEVVNNEITILADSAVAPEEIDVSAAREELAAADNAVASLDPMSEAYAAAQATRQWALARVGAVERSGSL